MFKSSKSKKGGLHTLCALTEYVVYAVAALAAIAAVIGAYQAHFLAAGVAFGTTTGSLSLAALVLTLMLLRKCMHSCSCQVSSKK